MTDFARLTHENAAPRDALIHRHGSVRCRVLIEQVAHRFVAMDAADGFAKQFGD